MGFLVPIAAGLSHPAQLSGQKICFLAATQVEPSLRSWFAHERLDFVPFPFNEEGEMEAAFVTNNCTALAGDLTRLLSTRLAFNDLAARYALLPGTLSTQATDPVEISADPLAAASLSRDPAFANIVHWTIEVLLNSEAINFTQRDAAAIDLPISKLLSPPGMDALQTKQPRHPSESPAFDDAALNVLTGRTREIGARLGLDNLWAAHVIAAVGNYAELYDRDLGAHSPLQLPRAQNRLATQGGLMLPLPLK